MVLLVIKIPVSSCQDSLSARFFCTVQTVTEPNTRQGLLRIPTDRGEAEYGTIILLDRQRKRRSWCPHLELTQGVPLLTLQTILTLPRSAETILVLNSSVVQQIFIRFCSLFIVLKIKDFENFGQENLIFLSYFLHSSHSFLSLDKVNYFEFFFYNNQKG